MVNARMIGVFGQREPELAAIKLLDAGWRTPFEPIRFKPDNDLERDGIQELIAAGYVDPLADGHYIATVAFWVRVHGR